MATILDEPVAIIAKRSEWAGVLNELSFSKIGRKLARENPQTFTAASTHADNPQLLIDKIAICVVDTQLRIERNAPINKRVVKILKSESLFRSAWEVREP